MLPRGPLPGLAGQRGWSRAGCKQPELVPRKWCKEPGSFWGPQQASASRGAERTAVGQHAACCRCQLRGSHMASSPACGMPERGQRWAARAARAAARPSADQGHREGVTESRAARCIPYLRTPGAQDTRTPAAPSRAIYYLSPESPAVSTGPCTQRRSHWQATLTTLGGSLCPGRYLTFSCSVLMMSVSRRPPTSSSSTHMFTWFSKVLSRAALLPAILAMAEPLRGQSRAVGSGHQGRWHQGAQCTTGH